MASFGLLYAASDEIRLALSDQPEHPDRRAWPML
jgi:hypothetical protein